VETVLRNKNNKPFELEIVETVFDDAINSYQLSIDHLLNDLCDNIMTDIKKHSKLYKRDKLVALSYTIYYTLSIEHFFDINTSSSNLYNFFFYKMFCYLFIIWGRSGAVVMQLSTACMSSVQFII